MGGGVEIKREKGKERKGKILGIKGEKTRRKREKRRDYKKKRKKLEKNMRLCLQTKFVWRD